jgi:hypothetical protein
VRSNYLGVVRYKPKTDPKKLKANSPVFYFCFTDQLSSLRKQKYFYTIKPNRIIGLNRTPSTRQHAGSAKRRNIKQRKQTLE